MKKEEILNAFNAHLGQSGRHSYSDFYIGLAENAKKSLFEDHLVPKKGAWYIYAPVDEIKDAYDVLSHFEDLGMRSANRLSLASQNLKGKKMKKTKQVYCYAVSPYTIEKKMSK